MTRIYQIAEGYCYNSDSLFLWDFCMPYLRRGSRVLELGSGSGIIGILCAREMKSLGKNIRLFQIEKQREYALLNAKNAMINGIDSTVINADCRDLLRLKSNAVHCGNDEFSETFLLNLDSKKDSSATLQNDMRDVMLSGSETSFDSKNKDSSAKPQNDVKSHNDINDHVECETSFDSKTNIESKENLDSKKDSSGIRPQKDRLQNDTNHVMLSVSETSIKTTQNDIQKKINTKLDSIKNTKFDLVISNPPFYANGTISSSNIYKEIATQSRHLDLESLFAISAKMLHANGRFIFCYNAFCLQEIMSALATYHFEIDKMQFVHARVDKKSKLVLISARKNSKKTRIQTIIAPPLITHIGRNQSDNSQRVKEIYKHANVHSIKVSINDIIWEDMA